MRKKYKNKSPELMQYEMDDCEWWMRHHKQSVQYLCIRIREYLDAKEDGDEKYVQFFEKHFNAVLPNFAESVGLELHEEEE